MKTTCLKAARALTLTGLALCAAIAQATPTTYSWSTVAINADAAYGLNIGDTISGVITYDVTGSSFKNGIANSSSSGYQYYNTPATTTTLNAGTYHGTVNLYAMIVNDFSMWGGDEFILRADSTALGALDMDFVDSSMAALSSLALPTAVNPAAFPLTTIYLSAVGYTPIKVSAAAAAVTAVPEPGTTALFGLALAGLALARRRRAG